MSLWSLARWVAVGLLALLVSAVLGLLWSTGWEPQSAATRLLQLWNEYSKVVDRIYDFVDRVARFIVPIATIGGAVYGVYHKWQYGKSRMHIHIRDFLKRDDKRLMPTGKRLAKLVDRPTPGRDFASPIFSADDLEPTFKQMRWGPLTKADTAISAELTKLQQQLEQWGNLEANYNRHRAQGHLLKGAIAAARAARTKAGSKDSRPDDTEAFEQFKAAHELDKADVEALEYLAHQRVRLGDYGNALSDFESLQELAVKNNDALLQARALKFQSAVREHEGTIRLAQNPQLPANQELNLQGARDLLTDSLAILPGAERGGLEEAELYELRGRVQKRRERFTAATNDTTAAERLYYRITQQTNGAHSRSPASEGLVRVRKALQEIRLRPLTPPGAPTNGGEDEPRLQAVLAEPPQLPNTNLTTKPTA